MHKKSIAIITIILLILSTLVPAIAISDQPEENGLNNTENITLNVTVRAVSIIRVPTDYQTIQEAIDNAPPESMIHIEDGEYDVTGNSIIINNKNHLLITGSKNAMIIVKSAYKFEMIRILNSDSITLSGFTVNVDNLESFQLFARNIAIRDSNNITLSNLSLFNSIRNTECRPVTISNSSNCRITNCSIETRCAHSISIESGSKENVIENNTIKPISIHIRNSANNTIRNNRISKMRFEGENNDTIYNNYISSMSIHDGNNSTICNNIILSVDAFNGNNNTLYLNNIFGRQIVQGNNNWNSTIPVNYTYNGSEYRNYTGNFWFDYKGADNNSDGIGDVPYEIGAGYDYYPLMKPFGLTFDIEAEGVSRPYILYANRTNPIYVSIKRSGTYPMEMDVMVNLTAYNNSLGTLIASNTIKMSPGRKILRFTWEAPEPGNYTLKVEVDNLDTVIDEMDDTNNELAINVSVSPPWFDFGENISSALDFLHGSQYLTGSISGFSNSARAALAIIAAGEDPSTGRWKQDKGSLIDYLRNKPKSSAEFSPGSNPSNPQGIEDIARIILVITAVGEDPTNFGDVNYLTMLKSYYDGEQFGKRDDVKDDAFAILALVACDDKNQRTDAMITNAVNYTTRTKQNGDGGWSSFSVDSDVRTTSLVIQALIAAGEDQDSDTIRTALGYLKNAQGDEGGYSNVITTSYAIQAFIAAEEDLSNYSKTIDYLLNLQQPDGSFNYTTNMSFFPPRMTIFPILAMCGEPYPVMIKTTNKSYELPDVSVSDVFTDDEICVNTSYTVKTDIKSNGGIFYADLLSDGEFVERKRVYSVWHDSLTPVSFTWKTNTTGPHNLTIFADSMNNITESDETNNNATMEVNVSLPDLYPSDITPPERTYVNVTNVISCMIKGTTDEHFNVTLEADGELLGKQRIEGIRDNFTLSFGWRPSKNKDYNLRLTVDSDAEVRERDDANNTLEERVTVQLPDLIPTSITADEIFVNARNKVNVTIEGMAECFNISLIEKGTVVDKTTNVTCYEKENVSIEWKPTSLGDHTITAFVDSDSDIKETDETNNKINATFEVLLPDLVPEEITPDVLYIDEVNTINVKVNGTAEGFNATLVADEIIDRSGPLSFVIIPVFNGTLELWAIETFSGTVTDSNLTYNITEQRANWSWKDIDTLSVIIASTTSTWLVDSGDTWSVDYVALVVNYTLNSTNHTVELNASSAVYSYNWLNENSTYLSDDEYATAAWFGSMRLGIRDTDAIYGNITSVAIKVEQHVVNAVSSKKDTSLKKTNLDTYNGSIEFEWLPMKLGEYKLSVFLDSDNNIEETNETNNNLSKSIIVAKRIDLELTSPLGGETWEGIQNVTWNASYEEPLLIDFYYSPDRGYRWINITTNETNDGSYAWNTEDVIDGEYMIKIVARAGMVTAEDRSDVFFVRNTKAGMEWGSFHENAGYAPCDGPDTNEIAWESIDIDAEGSSSLIVARGKVFVHCSTGGSSYLVALDQSNGEVLWGTPVTLGGAWATPAYKDGTIFVCSKQGVYWIAADDGHKIGEFESPTGKGSVNGGPAVTSRAVYVGDWDGRHYYCINISNPQDVFWNFTVSSYAQSVPAVAYGNVYFGSWSDVYAVNAWNGTEVWSTPSGTYGSVTVADRVVYFTRYNFYGMGTFFALDAFNGTQIWYATIEPTDSTPAYYPSPCKSVRGYIYTAGGGASSSIKMPAVRCLNAKTGELIWIENDRGSWTNSPVVTRDGKVFVGKECSDGMVPGYCGLYCLDALTGEEIWHSDYGGSSPVVVNGFVYTIDASGKVIAFGNDTKPDLTVVEVKNDPDKEYVVNEPGNITAIIENIGKANITEPFEVALRYSGNLTTPIDLISVDPPFNVSERRPAEFEWTPEEPGKNYLTVEVDPGRGNITELNSTNNLNYTTVDVKDNMPDLTTSISGPKTAVVGETIIINATIENIGNETNESFFVKFEAEDGYSAKYENKSLKKSQNLPQNSTWSAPDVGTYELTAFAHYYNNTVEPNYNRHNNRDSMYVTVTESTPTPTPTPTSTPKTPGFGPGSGGGYGGGSAGGIGAGSGTGEAGSGEAGGMQIPVNASGSAGATEKEALGYPFGNATSGESGGGGMIRMNLILLVVLVIMLFYFLGYYKEKRAHAKRISPRDFRPEGEKRAYRRNRK